MAADGSGSGLDLHASQSGLSYPVSSSTPSRWSEDHGWYQNLRPGETPARPSPGPHHPGLLHHFRHSLEREKLFPHGDPASVPDSDALLRDGVFALTASYQPGRGVATLFMLGFHSDARLGRSEPRVRSASRSLDGSLTAPICDLPYAFSGSAPFRRGELLYANVCDRAIISSLLDVQNPPRTPDTETAGIIETLFDGASIPPSYQLRYVAGAPDGILCLGHRIVIPREYVNLQLALVGFVTFDALCRDFYWTGGVHGSKFDTCLDQPDDSHMRLLCAKFSTDCQVCSTRAQHVFYPVVPDNMPPVDIRHLAVAWQALWAPDRVAGGSLRLPFDDRKLTDQRAVGDLPERDTVSAPRPAPSQLEFGKRHSPELQSIVDEFLDLAEFNGYLTPLPDSSQTILTAHTVAAASHGASTAGASQGPGPSFSATAQQSGGRPVSPFQSTALSDIDSDSSTVDVSSDIPVFLRDPPPKQARPSASVVVIAGDFAVFFTSSDSGPGIYKPAASFTTVTETPPTLLRVVLWRFAPRSVSFLPRSALLRDSPGRPTARRIFDPPTSLGCTGWVSRYRRWGIAVHQGVPELRGGHQRL